MFTQLAKIWEGVVAQLFDKESFDAVFTHARNVLTGAAVVAAGLYAVHHVGGDVPLTGRGTFTSPATSSPGSARCCSSSTSSTACASSRSGVTRCCCASPPSSSTS